MRDAASPEPGRDCPLCPRLVAYRRANQAAEPTWFNGPAPSFGPANARLVIVGLAPGRSGANRTGRPFTGDYAGELLYDTLAQHGFSRGVYDRRPDDGLELVDCLITNAVRCAPPENKPTGEEAKTCRRFLSARLAAAPDARAILVLGRVAHDNTLAALGLKAKDAPFAHGAEASLAPWLGARVLVSSYHCSRYNTQTGRLTAAMFDAVVARCRAIVGRTSAAVAQEA